MLSGLHEAFKSRRRANADECRLKQARLSNTTAADIARYCPLIKLAADAFRPLRHGDIIRRIQHCKIVTKHSCLFVTYIALAAAAQKQFRAHVYDTE